MDGSENRSSYDGEAFVRMWTDFASKMMSAGMAAPPGSSPPDLARQARSAWFQACEDYCQQFMRSSQFQEGMHRSLAASVELRKQMNDFLGRVQHELQGASRQDLDQLMLAMRHLEQRLVDGFERLSERLDEISRRLDGLDAEAESSPGSKANRRSGRKHRKSGESRDE